MKKILFVAFVAVLAACTSQTSVKLMDASRFEGEVDGKAIGLYTLTAGDIILQATNYGARVTSIYTPDREGNWVNIVVGHDNLDAYINPPAERFLGACVGPVANRIGKARFVVNGVEYKTPANDNEVNTLHGGFIGLDHVVWDVLKATQDSLVLFYLHPDGQEGYPGNLAITMTYSVDENNQFNIDYKAQTDKTTPVNITNHPFFCLRGEGTGSVEEYQMWIKASHYLPIDALSIPTGEIASVEGTPFDFRETKTIGRDIEVEHEQLKNAKGYDHNWCIDKESAGVEKVCYVYDAVSGRKIEVFTDQQGLQFYSGNFFADLEKGSNGRSLGFRSSLALETQAWPDAVNHDNFPSILLQPGDCYTQTCIYRFSVE